jgi:hypothetical protein
VSSELLGSGSADGLTVLPYTEPWIDGEPFAAVAVAAPAELQRLVGDWVTLLRARAAEDPGAVAFDLLPHNLLYTANGVAVIDDEWRSTSLTLDDVIRRGAVLLARDLGDLSGPEHWGARSRRELAVRIADFAGVPLDAPALAAAVMTEAELQAKVGGGEPGTRQHERTVRAVEDELLFQLDRIDGGVPTLRLWEALDEQRRDAIAARDLLFATGLQLDEARKELGERRAELSELRARSAHEQRQPWRSFWGRTRARIRAIMRRSRP